MAEEKVYRASTIAPVNIAVIKYWGKRDARLNLPTNSSLSVTLSQADLCTTTTATCSASYEQQDSLILNGEPQNLQTQRTQACLQALRSQRQELELSDSSLPTLSKYGLRIVSVNNFPTAAGLASSAAGFAALVRAIADLYQLTASPAQLSIIARQGSGSACRSLLGGYVAWECGQHPDGSDSLAVQVAPASHWPEIRALILVVSAAKKAVGSTEGMQTTVQTSSLFPARASTIVPQRMHAMQTAILARDFESFAKITTQDSNSFHATCLDSDPPIFYMNDVSRAIVRAVEQINTLAGQILAAYTFDAGPNAVIYYLANHQDQVAGPFKSMLSHVHGWQTTTGQTITSPVSLHGIDGTVVSMIKQQVGRVILTAVGEGPQQTHGHLVNESGQMIFQS